MYKKEEKVNTKNTGPALEINYSVSVHGMESREVEEGSCVSATDC